MQQPPAGTGRVFDALACLLVATTRDSFVATCQGRTRNIFMSCMQSLISFAELQLTTLGGCKQA